MSAPAPTIGALDLARATLGGALNRNRGRLALAVLAIALGVALGFAVATINRTAVGEFVGGMRTLSGTADLEIRGPRGGFDETVFPRIARTEGVAVASPVVEVDAPVAGRSEALRIYGVDAFRAGRVTPALVGSAEDALDVLRPGVVFLSPAAAAWLGANRGDTVAVQAGLGTVSLAIAGRVAGAAAGQRYAVMDIAALQDAFGRGGTLSRIDVRAQPGTDLAALRTRLAGGLPPGVAIATPADNAAVTARMSRAYRVNLNVLALVALFTGGLLVFSTQALAVVRRRPQFALLRTLGMSRRRLVRWLLVEGALIGAVGALAGIVGGYVLARVVLQVFGADLGAGYFRGSAPAVSFDPVAALAFGLIGIAAALLGTALPAREAARAVPAAALKAGSAPAVAPPLRSPVPGLALLALGAALAALPPVGGLPLPGYAAIALLLFGTLLLLPRLFAFCTRRLPRARFAPALLAQAQLRGHPGEASVSLATIVASVSLMVSMAIMVASFRQSLDDWLHAVLPADIYLRAGGTGDTAFFDPAAQRALAAVPGVARVDFLRVQSILLGAGAPRVTLLARDLPAADPAHALPLAGDSLVPPPGAPPPVWISEAVVDLHGLRPGTVVPIALDGRAHPFFVAGVWRDYARQHGALVIERAAYVRLTGDATANDGAVTLAPGADAARVREALLAAVPEGRMTLSTPGEIRSLSLAIFDRTFAVTYALEAAAVLIGLVGLSSSFGALVLARRREFGMLRHLGMTRRQIATMLGLEGLAVSGIGLAVGLALGWVMSLVLVHVVNRQSFHWGMQMDIPWRGLALLTLTLLVLALATTIGSARAAMGRDVVRAVKDDW